MTSTTPRRARRSVIHAFRTRTTAAQAPTALAWPNEIEQHTRGDRMSDIEKILADAKKYINQGPSPFATGSATDTPPVRYEALSVHEKHVMAHENPDRFQELRADWQARGEPAAVPVLTV